MRWARVSALTRVVVAMAVVVGMLGPGAGTAQAASEIDELYDDTGDWPSVSHETFTISDSGPLGKDPYSIYYPTNLGAGGYDHPILVWGNGTGATSSDYQELLEHLASWGYVVVAPDNSWVGNGLHMWAATSHIMQENTNSTSTFYEKLDLSKIGMLGHSQGAGGTVNAAKLVGPGVVKSALTISLPDPWTWCLVAAPEDEFPCAELEEPEADSLLTDFPASLFLMRGDLVISTETLIATEPQAVEWFNQVPGMAVKGSREGCGHVFCIGPPWTTDLAVKGYITAWFEYTLKGDTYARDAFVPKPTAEIFTNGLWDDADVKNPI